MKLQERQTNTTNKADNDHWSKNNFSSYHEKTVYLANVGSFRISYLMFVVVYLMFVVVYLMFVVVYTVPGYPGRYCWVLLPPEQYRNV